MPALPSRRRTILQGIAGVAGALGCFPRASLGTEPKSITLCNWATYIGRNTLADFEKATGVNVKTEYYELNDELVARMVAGDTGYDVIVPASEGVEALARLKLLLPLDHSLIPNLVNIDKQMRDAAFDRGRRYSIPYTWGTVGIGYRKSQVDEPVASWKLLFESDRYAQRISLLDNSVDVLGCGLKYLGFSYNSVGPAELQAVEKLILKQKKNIRSFAPDNGQELLAAGEVVACQEYNGDIAQLMIDDLDVSYALPAEGSSVWQDCLCIPADAPNPDAALAFINFVLEPEVGKDIAETIQYATPNAAARALMDPRYLDNPAIYPPAEYIAKCEPGLDLGEEGNRLRAEIWSRIKAG